jgi:hypothetical protein
MRAMRTRTTMQKMIPNADPTTMPTKFFSDDDEDNSWFSATSTSVRDTNARSMSINFVWMRGPKWNYSRLVSQTYQDWCSKLIWCSKGSHVKVFSNSTPIQVPTRTKRRLRRTESIIMNDLRSECAVTLLCWSVQDVAVVGPTAAIWSSTSYLKKKTK